LELESKVSNKLILINDRQANIIWQRVQSKISMFPKTWLSLCMLAIPLFLLIPFLNSFPYPNSGSLYSDLTISHYPNGVFLKDAILNMQEIPLWSPTILTGYPFAANPLSGLWYPLGWLILITPLPLGFNLLVGLHLIWGGLGLYFLMKEEGLSHDAALFAGFSFALLPKLFSHYGAGHLTLLYALPWTPWLLWCQHVSSKPRIGRKSLSVPPGLVLALIFLADIRWGAFAFVLWWAYAAAHWRGKWRELILKLIKQMILGLLLAAPLLLPLVEYSLLSTRSMLGVEDVLAYSLPFMHLLGLIFPNARGWHEWVLYSGGMVLLLGVVGLTAGKLRRNKLFWGIVSLISIIIALGSQIPGSELVASLPVVRLIRVPSRALFLTGLSLAALAGYGVETIIFSSNKTNSQKLNIVLISVIIFSLILTAGVFLLENEVPGGLLWGTGGLVLSAVWIGLGLQLKKLPLGIWLAGVFIITLFDLGVIDLNSFQGRAADQVLAEREPVAQFIAKQPGDFRTYSPSYSIPQNTAVRYGIQMADGVDPMQLEKYAIFMDEASGVPRDGYSVTVPPYANGDPKHDNAEYSPLPDQLGLLNVGYVVSDYELNVDGLTLVEQIAESYIYKNAYQMAPAWVEDRDDPLEQGREPVDIIERSPNHLLLSASGPGLLTLSEINYPGWQAKVDGRERKLLTQSGVLRAVELKPGQHEIELSFRPISVFVGIILFFLGSVVLILNIWSLRKSSSSDLSNQSKTCSVNPK
jgi:hypothetical protein